MGEHFKTTADLEETWRGFQEHNGLTDEELQFFKNDPKRIHYVPKMGEPDFHDWTMVVEVVDVHSCAVGMKVGDRLYYKSACGILDTERSCKTGWCIHAMNVIDMHANMIHNLLHSGVEDPNVFIYGPHLACTGIDTKYGGWGSVTLKFWCFRESLGEDYKDWANPTYED